MNNSSKSLGEIMVEGKWTGEQVQKTLDETANYYKSIMKTAIPELETFVNNLSLWRPELNVDKLKAIIYRFKNESYGV